MPNIRRLTVKLKNNSGITIVMALFFLLIASMISVVILSAAQTAMKNSAADKKAQQAYLTVSSFADFMAQRISDAELSISDSSGTRAYSGDFTNTPFYPIVKRAIEAVEKSGEFDESFTLVADTQLLDPVRVRFMMDEDYDIKAYLHLDGDPEPDYYMTLTILSGVIETDSGRTLTWSESSFKKGWV